MIMTLETKLPDNWIWGDEPSGERLELLLKYYNMWLEIKHIGVKLHDFDEYYICAPTEWQYSPCHPDMPIEEVKGWLEGVDEALKSARNDLKKLE